MCKILKKGRRQINRVMGEKKRRALKNTRYKVARNLATWFFNPAKYPVFCNTFVTKLDTPYYEGEKRKTRSSHPANSLSH